MLGPGPRFAREGEGFPSRCHRFQMPPQQQRRSTVYCSLWKLFEQASIQENEEVDPTSKIYIFWIRDLGIPPQAVWEHVHACALGSCVVFKGMIGIKGWRAGCADGMAAAERRIPTQRGGGRKILPCITSHFVRVRRTNASCAWGGTAHWQGPLQ